MQIDGEPLEETPDVEDPVAAPLEHLHAVAEALNKPADLPAHEVVRDLLHPPIDRPQNALELGQPALTHPLAPSPDRALGPRLRVVAVAVGPVHVATIDGNFCLRHLLFDRPHEACVQICTRAFDRAPQCLGHGAQESSYRLLLAVRKAHGSYAFVLGLRGSYHGHRCVVVGLPGQKGHRYRLGRISTKTGTSNSGRWRRRATTSNPCGESQDLDHSITRK
jgi:hypothetical protein